MADAVNKMTSIESGALPGGGAWEVMKIFDGELVNAAADVDSIFGLNVPGLQLTQFRTFGFYVTCTSAGSVNIIFQIVQSWDQTSANFVVPDSGGTIGTVTDENPHIFTVTPSPMPYIRFRANGQAGNDASTTVTAYAWMQT